MREPSEISGGPDDVFGQVKGKKEYEQSKEEIYAKRPFPRDHYCCEEHAVEGGKDIKDFGKR
jgi:hypothetical protein